PVVQREIRLELPFILSKPDVVLQLALAHSSRAIVERTRRAYVAQVLDRRGRISEEIGKIVKYIRRSTLSVGVKTIRSTFKPELEGMLVLGPRERIGKRERIYGVGMSAARR